MPDYKRIIQSSVNYIENNLHNRFAMEDVSEHAGFSLYHFMRMFYTYTGYSLKEYVRVRRLSEAAAELVHGSLKVKELAGKMGFDSPEAFIRAFKREFRITPSQYRNNNQLILYTPKLKVQICPKINGGNKMDYKIKEMPELKVLGLKRKVKHDGSIGKLWNEFTGRFSELEQYKDAPLVGVVPHDKRFEERAPKADESFWYMTGVIVQNVDNIPKGMEIYTIKPAKYAIFTYTGPIENMCSIFNYICVDWIENVEYEFAPFDEIEWYDERYKPEDPENSQIDMYIPIR